MELRRNLKENLEILDEELGIEKSFDVVNREIIIGDKNASLLFIDGFAKDDIMVFVMEILQNIDEKDFRRDAIKKLIKQKIPYLEVEASKDIEQIKFMILSGALAILLDGEEEGIILDVRTYPVRGPQEPDLERVTRGARDGLTETIVFNTALIRRRVRDPKLRFEITKVGRRSQTDVVVGYIEDIANPKLVQEIKDKLDQIDTDALEMAEKTLEEFILGRNWNPLPQARYTERPDVAATHLFEGHIIVMVDTTPSVMILPVTIFHFTQHAEDYYQNPAVGTYMRWIRLMAMVLSYIVPPLWLVLVYNKGILPSWLKFIGPKETGEISLFLQFVILEIGIDILRIASIHTPNALTTSLGIIGGLILSEFAVKVGWFIPETVLYMAIASIGMFATPSIEFSMAIRIFRMILLISTGLFKGIGFFGALLVTFIVLFTTKSFGGVRYLWPLIPFNKRGLATVLFRKPIPEVRYRPDFLHTIDRDAAPPKDETPK
ncbi:spore germination protein [Marinisporobacter balticus]|uniref:Stage V sporulation protein AF n=1 Tax=Marinisporobacter balticus TaxID=2018667 RepID=A0A4R2KJL5_9FIRM|nr:spore germination protein [Marinisporobacter balticus]TCO70198.1 stage V sporulation protein AF [Marinisporobacter balticus]